MHKIWVHNEHRVLGPGFYPAFNGRLRASAQSTAQVLIRPQPKLVPLFMILASVALILSCTIIALNFKSAWVRIESLVSNDSSLGIGSYRSKTEFLRSLSSVQRKELASQVHFVSQIISERRPKINARLMAKEIVAESFSAGFDPLLATSIILSESAFNQDAQSHKGARGLMQLIPSTAEHVAELIGSRWFGTHKLHDTNYNLKLGIAYMKHLSEIYKGDTKKALIAYNWGPGNLDKAHRYGRLVPQGPVHYAKEIISRQSRWSRDLEKHQAGYKFINPDMILG